MKKSNPKRRWWFNLQQQRKRIRQTRGVRFKSPRNVKEALNLDSREKVRREVYKKKRYDGEKLTIAIEDDFGIENELYRKDFMQIAANIIDTDARSIIFDMRNCSNVRPSSIALLASFKQWTDLKSAKTSRNKNLPKVGSTDSSNNHVNAYLKECGFYDYVNRQSSFVIEPGQLQEEIVKIVHEEHRDRIPIREEEIDSLLKGFCGLNLDQQEEFMSIVVVESLNNISEHGVMNFNGDLGFWITARYDEQLDVISLCFADNGIGIRNSLCSGPLHYNKTIFHGAKSDSDFIKLSLTEIVSGARTALDPKQKWNWYIRRSLKYPKGSRRGNGLKRVMATCKRLGIKWSILSHYGYVHIGEDGTFHAYGSFKNRIFAGTLYHFMLPGSKRLNQIG